MTKPIRVRTVHRCTECGASAAKWAGRCATCGAWNSLVEEPEEARSVSVGFGPIDVPVPIAEVDTDAAQPRPTGIGELDRVLGGGLVAGSVTLVGGEPGIGKSTLLLQALDSIAQRGSRCLLVSAEESAQQVTLRARRLGTLAPALFLLSERAVPNIVAAVEKTKPDLLVVDSIQTVFDPEFGPAPGTVTQVREVAAQLVVLAKQL